MQGARVIVDSDAHRAAARLLDIINANWMTQAVGVAAELRVADALAGGARDIDSLAETTSCDPSSLRRLMRALASLGICIERDDGSFEITPMGSLLRDDANPSVRSSAIWTALCQWGTWGHLVDSVKTGKSARTLLTGRDGYAHLEGDPKAASIFNRAMVELTQLIADSVARTCDFSSAKRLVDVGGGYGELLVEILSAHPGLYGILFDLPHAVESARSRIGEAGLAPRCDLVSGSFFESVPSGGDVYLLKSILHNWDDERCAVILRQCRHAMTTEARLLIVDRLMPERIAGLASETAIFRSDLNMLVGLGGRERTRTEFAALLAQAGFLAGRCVAIALGFGVIEAQVANG